MLWKEDAPQELENKMDELDLSKITNAKSNDMGEAVADNDLYDSREERDSQRDDMSRSNSATGGGTFTLRRCSFYIADQKSHIVNRYSVKNLQ